MARACSPTIGLGTLGRGKKPSDAGATSVSNGLSEGGAPRGRTGHFARQQAAVLVDEKALWRGHDGHPVTSQASVDGFASATREGAGP